MSLILNTFHDLFVTEIPVAGLVPSVKHPTNCMGIGHMHACLDAPAHIGCRNALICVQTMHDCSQCWLVHRQQSIIRPVDTPHPQVGTGMSSGLNDGWGLAFDGEHLLATESSAQVHWLDPKTLAVVKSLTVKDREQPIKWLNEVSAF